MNSEHGTHSDFFDKDFTEVLTNDSVIDGSSGLQGCPSDVNGDFINIDTSTTTDPNMEQSMTGNQTFQSHQENNL